MTLYLPAGPDWLRILYDLACDEKTVLKAELSSDRQRFGGTELVMLGPTFDARYREFLQPYDRQPLMFGQEIRSVADPLQATIRPRSATWKEGPRP